MALYFAYGSNLQSARLRARVPGAAARAVAYLEDHRWLCNKRGADGSAKANIERASGERVWGVVFVLGNLDLEQLDRFEGGYRRLVVEVVTSTQQQMSAHTYLSDRILRDERPTAEYLGIMLDGAREHGLPQGYVARLEALETRG